jgi:hypothetical protein
MLKNLAFFAETRVISGLVPAHQVHDKSTPALEGRTAQFAARVCGEQSMKMIETAGDWLALGQHFVPFFFNSWIRGHDSLQP